MELTVTEAAEKLGVSPQAVRKRMAKFTAEEAGRWICFEQAGGRKTAFLRVAAEGEECPALINELRAAMEPGETEEAAAAEASEPETDYAEALIAELKADKERLQRELDEERRRNAELSAQMAELAKNAQALTDNAQKLQAAQLMQGKRRLFQWLLPKHKE